MWLNNKQCIKSGGGGARLGDSRAGRAEETRTPPHFFIVPPPHSKLRIIEPYSQTLPEGIELNPSLTRCTKNNCFIYFF